MLLRVGVDLRRGLTAGWDGRAPWRSAPSTTTVDGDASRTGEGEREREQSGEAAPLGMTESAGGHSL